MFIKKKNCKRCISIIRCQELNRRSKPGLRNLELNQLVSLFFNDKDGERCYFKRCNTYKFVFTHHRKRRGRFQELKLQIPLETSLEGLKIVVLEKDGQLKFSEVLKVNELMNCFFWEREIHSLLTVVNVLCQVFTCPLM